MRKYEFIKQEWLKLIPEEDLPEIDENGKTWINDSRDKSKWNVMGTNSDFVLSGYDPWKTGRDSHIQKMSITPRSLINLKENNGWTKTDDSMPPKDYTKYDVCIDNIPHDLLQTGFRIHLIFYDKSQSIKITHFKKHETLKPPIY